MTDPRPPTPPRHPLLRAILRIPVFVAATIYFLIDDVVLALVRPVIAWAAELRLFTRIGAALQRLSPYPTLAVFLVPYIVLEPFKLWALWLMASGRFSSGVIMLTLAHLVSIVLVERLFHATRDKLLTIAWFARLHGWVSALYDWSIGRLRATPAWQAMAAFLRGLRQTVRGLLAKVRPKIAALVASLRRLRDDFGR